MSTVEEQVKGRNVSPDKLVALINTYHVGNKVICWHWGG